MTPLITSVWFCVQSLFVFLGQIREEFLLREFKTAHTDYQLFQIRQVKSMRRKIAYKKIYNWHMPLHKEKKLSAYIYVLIIVLTTNIHHGPLPSDLRMIRKIMLVCQKRMLSCIMLGKVMSKYQIHEFKTV